MRDHLSTERLDRLMDSLEDGNVGQVLKQEQGLKRTLFDIYIGQRFIVTETGRFGLFTANSEVGADVMLVDGVKAPFTMYASYKRVVLVYPAYVHGIMDGEAFKEGEEGTISRSYSLLKAAPTPPSM
jgi:hypothetical protein